MKQHEDQEGQGRQLCCPKLPSRLNRVCSIASPAKRIAALHNRGQVWAALWKGCNNRFTGRWEASTLGASLVHASRGISAGIICSSCSFDVHAAAMVNRTLQISGTLSSYQSAVNSKHNLFGKHRHQADPDAIRNLRSVALAIQFIAT